LWHRRSILQVGVVFVLHALGLGHNHSNTHSLISYFIHTPPHPLTPTHTHLHTHIPSPLPHNNTQQTRRASRSGGATSATPTTLPTPHTATSRNPQSTPLPLLTPPYLQQQMQMQMLLSLMLVRLLLRLTAMQLLPLSLLVTTVELLQQIKKTVIPQKSLRKQTNLEKIATATVITAKRSTLQKTRRKKMKKNCSFFLYRRREMSS
jgi:hypothetical protein